jgi:hypothetical protein
MIDLIRERGVLGVNGIEKPLHAKPESITIQLTATNIVHATDSVYLLHHNPCHFQLCGFCKEFRNGMGSQRKIILN